MKKILEVLLYGDDDLRFNTDVDQDQLMHLFQRPGSIYPGGPGTGRKTWRKSLHLRAGNHAPKAKS